MEMQPSTEKKKHIRRRSRLNLFLQGMIIAAIAGVIGYTVYDHLQEPPIVIEQVDPVYDLYRDGLHHYNALDYDQAIEVFSQVIDIDDTYINAYYSRAVAYSLTGQDDLALIDFNVVVELSPSTSTYNNRGYTYNMLGEYDLALEDLNRALEINPAHAFAHNNRGYTYFNMGEYALALKDHNISEQLDPTNAYVYQYRGQVYHAMGEDYYALALADYYQYEAMTGDLLPYMHDQLDLMEATLATQD